MRIVVPTLQAGPLRLVPFQTAHLTADYVAWLNDPAVVRFSENRHRTHTLDSCRAFTDTFVHGPNQLWAIECDELGGHIGNITATFDTPNRLCDIGILIGAGTARGRGLGRYAWQAVLDYLCRRGDLVKITGGCMALNLAMVRIMRACGMQPDGCRPAHHLLDGEPVDVVHFARHVGPVAPDATLDAAPDRPATRHAARPSRRPMHR